MLASLTQLPTSPLQGACKLSKLGSPKSWHDILSAGIDVFALSRWNTPQNAYTDAQELSARQQSLPLRKSKAQSGKSQADTVKAPAVNTVVLHCLDQGFYNAAL